MGLEKAFSHNHFTSFSYTYLIKCPLFVEMHIYKVKCILGVGFRLFHILLSTPDKQSGKTELLGQKE